jgi:hypothetical protein
MHNKRQKNKKRQKKRISFDIGRLLFILLCRKGGYEDFIPQPQWASSFEAQQKRDSETFMCHCQRGFGRSAVDGASMGVRSGGVSGREGAFPSGCSEGVGINFIPAHQPLKGLAFHAAEFGGRRDIAL